MMATSKKDKHHRIQLYNLISRVLGLDFASGIHKATWSIGLDEHNISYVIDCDMVFDKVQVFVKVLTLILTTAEIKELNKLFHVLKTMKRMGYTVRFNTDTVSDLAGLVGSAETRFIFYKKDLTMPFNHIKFYVHN